MHDVRVEMKDGTVLTAPLWTWRPDLGWFTLVGIERTILLSDVKAAVQKDTRKMPGNPPLFGTETVDLLERARREGWNGA